MNREVLAIRLGKERRRKLEVLSRRRGGAPLSALIREAIDKLLIEESVANGEGK